MSSETTFLVSPKIALTTSRRPAHLTNRLMKALSAMLGAPIYRRGSSTLEEVARACKEVGLTNGFIVLYSKRRKPSLMTCYKISEDGKPVLFGRIFIIDFSISPAAKQVFTDVMIELAGKSQGARELFEFLRDYLRESAIKESRRYVRLIVEDMPEDEAKKIHNGKLRPAVMKFVDRKGRELLVIEIHHVHRYQ